MNYRQKKRDEANRLLQRMQEANLFRECYAEKINKVISVRWVIQENIYDYPITVELLRKSVRERTKKFDEFVAQSIVHASQIRALNIMYSKMLEKEGEDNGEEPLN